MLLHGFVAFTLAAAGVSMVPDGSSPAVGSTLQSSVSRWGAPPVGEAYGWPTGVPVAVVRGFSGPSVPWGTGHRGVDLALTAGAPVYAAAAGVVAFAGTVVDRPVVSVDHADGIRTTYEPVVPGVAAGDVVRRGEPIGTLAPGHCGVPCLHFGARTGRDSYVDPLLLLVDPVVRLYP